MTKFDEYKELAKQGVYTHSATFHADDVLTACMLRISGIIPNYEIIKRVPKWTPEMGGLAFDVGGGELDHHGNNNVIRLNNGFKYAAALGLLWHQIGVQAMQDLAKDIVLISEEERARNGVIEPAMLDLLKNDPELGQKGAEIAAELFDQDFITAMDLTDNFGQSKYPNTLAYLISASNPVGVTDEVRDKAFFLCCKYMHLFVDNAIVSAFRNGISKQFAFKLAEGDVDRIVNESGMHIAAYLLKETKVKAVIEPSIRTTGCWNVTCVDGCKIADNIEVGKNGCTFIHATRFMAVFDNKDAAVNCTIN